MTDNPKGSLEKIILAGIGAMATTAEKSKELLDELIKKGELTVEQGKTINEELKHDVKTTLCDAGKSAREFAVSNVIENLDKLNPDEIAQIRAKLQELEKAEDKKDSDADSEA